MERSTCLCSLKSPPPAKLPKQLEREIENRLNARYMRSPQVTVFVREFNSQRVTVEGAVKTPGVLGAARQRHAAASDRQERRIGRQHGGELCRRFPHGGWRADDVGDV